MSLLAPCLAVMNAWSVVLVIASPLVGLYIYTPTLKPMLIKPSSNASVQTSFLVRYFSF